MIRKFAIAAAIAAVSTAAFTAPAFAKGGGFGGGHHGHGFRGGVGFVAVETVDACYTKEVPVLNRRGQVIGVRLINVCD